MHNIATIYRFNTPFLDLDSEKNNIKSVLRKIEKSISCDDINFEKKIETLWNYNKITLYFEDKLWEIEFFYIKDDIEEYYLPVFKLNIFLQIHFLDDNNFRKKAVHFLSNIFECFDWLTEKEFLIDINNDLYYKKWLFNAKVYPDYDFSDIENIRKSFEDKNWIVLLEDFIKTFSNKDFELTLEKSKYFYKLHSIFLYFVYLIFIMYQNIEKSVEAKKDLEQMKWKWLYEEQIELMWRRLSYVENLELSTFKKYKNRLELFFKLL